MDHYCDLCMTEFRPPEIIHTLSFGPISLRTCRLCEAAFLVFVKAGVEDIRAAWKENES